MTKGLTISIDEPCHCDKFSIIPVFLPVLLAGRIDLVMGLISWQ